MLMKDPIENLTFYIPGAYAQYMRVPGNMIRAGAVLPISDTVTDEEAALVVFLQTLSDGFRAGKKYLPFSTPKLQPEVPVSS